MNYLFAPGCALMLYKPQLVAKIHKFLNHHYGEMESSLTCCRHSPPIALDRQFINICPGCDRRYRKNYDRPATISLWELLAENDSFIFPDYQSAQMTILDACPARNQDRIHQAVRTLADKMNISLVEPAKTRRKSTCCGDSFFGELPTEEVIGRMKEKAAELPREEVIVYCVSCSKSMFLGGVRPRYLADLLFAEETIPRTCDPDQWHRELDDFIDNHRNEEGKAS
ncbi:MAG: hypothetical protein QMD32_08065 [Smithellaceae bacterium]|nr:hypothetical protein [Smithellaceae bacterium]